MGGVIFHEKQGTLTDCYKAWGTITLPAASNMLATSCNALRHSARRRNRSTGFGATSCQLLVVADF